MIKLIIFDLDGVLISSKDVHFRSLNQALSELAPEHIISYEEHLAYFDGLSTARKIQILAKRGLHPELHEEIKRRKQIYTTKELEDSVQIDNKLIDIFKTLKRDGYKIHVASNAIFATIDTILRRKGVFELVDLITSNEDVKHQKPNPEMYLRGMIHEGVGPRETIIFEDSYVGRQAVFNSGAYLGPINDPKELTLSNIRHMITNTGNSYPKWKDENLTILVPMAGAGSRFAKAGYTFPKPLIEVAGKPMIEVVVDNINIEAKYVFVVQKSHYEQYNLKFVLNMIAPNCEIVQIEGITEGAACTTLLAREFIDNSSQLLIANSDQWIDWDSSDFMYSMQREGTDGGILTFESVHPKWSYAKVDGNDVISEVREKQPISKHATVGIYYWKKGSDYVKFTDQMIAKDVRVNGEFYVCPVYNEAIEAGKVIRNYPVKKMMGLGTPPDLEEFLRNGPLCKNTK